MSFTNKINGCLMGYAIGDALGLGTEFMTTHEVKRRYPTGLRNFAGIIRDAHRSQWRRGDFTHDTEMVLTLTNSISENGKVDHQAYACKLKEWYDEHKSCDIDNHMRWVLEHPDFTTNPHKASEEAYHKQKRFEAPNEALGRALIAGLWPENVERNVTDNCRITHWDSRCICSCVIIGVMANELLWHRREADYDLLTGICRRIDDRALPYIETARYGNLADFFLDDEETYWYTRKAMGTALWALWHHTDPVDALYEVVDQGGDANTNGALTLALMGLKYGHSKITPSATKNLLESDRVLATAAALAETLQKAAPQKDTDE